MLVDLNATRLVDNRSVVQLAEFINGKKGSLRFGSRSRDADLIIEMCTCALKRFNRDVRLADCQVVYLEKDDFIVMGVLHDGNLIKAYDHKAIANQFHIDNSMAIFAHPTKLLRMTDTHKHLMLDIPNKLQYDELYYDPIIFNEFITETTKDVAFDSSMKNDIAILTDLIHRSSYIVKDTTLLDRADADVLNDLINKYGAYLIGLRYNEYTVPDKYVISKTWFDKVQVNLTKNPYFIFRHVWRCYFRLCKEGYRFNA